MTENIKKLLTKLPKFKEVWSKLPETLSEGEKGDSELSEFIEKISEASTSVIVSKSLEGEANRLKEGPTTSKYDNEDLFKECQELSVEVFKDWNESAINLALALYTSNEGKISTEDEEVFLTYGELFGLSEKDEDFKKLSTISNKTNLDTEDFLENRKYPVNTLENFTLTLKALDRTEVSEEIQEKVSAAGRRYGLFVLYLSQEKVFGVSADLIVLDEAFGEQDTLLEFSGTLSDEEMAAVKDSYQLTDEQIETLKNSVEIVQKVVDRSPLFETDSTVVSIVVSKETVLKDFLKRDENPEIREFLLPLVGIVRQMKLSKEAIAEMSEGYQTFSSTVLMKLLENLPKGSEGKDPETLKETTHIKVIPNPLADTGAVTKAKGSVKTDTSIYRTSRRSEKKENK